MTPFRLASLLSIALPLAFHSEAIAQDAAVTSDKGGVGAVAGSLGSAPPDDLPPASAASPDVRQDVTPLPPLPPLPLADIIVTAPRYGEAEIEAESEFSEAEIATQGADSIAELLDFLAPFIDGSGEEPIILVNGKPAEFDRSILSYPSEALTRLTVLKPEAAARYGHPPGRRVVNLVLKRAFASLTIDAGGSFATAGGQQGGTVTVGRVAIAGDTRWNAQARLNAQSALFRSARNLPPRDGVFDAIGAIVDPDGAIFAVPSDAASRVPTLADFASGAEAFRPVDPDDFETLTPLRRTMSLNAGVTRPIGDFSASLSINANRTRSEGLRGLPFASILLPLGSPWSPFADDVRLIRPFAGMQALRAETGSDSLGSTLTLSGRIGDWQTSIGANYSRNWTDNLLENGIDIDALRQQVDDGLNPYGPFDQRLLLASATRSSGESMGARLNIGKPILDLAAGPLTTSLSLDAARSHSLTRRSLTVDDIPVSEQRTRSQANGRLGFALPLSRREDAEWLGLGDLSVEASLTARALSDSGLQKGMGGGATWSPVSALQLRGSFDWLETAPTLDQLDGPLVSNVSRVFDFVRQETVEVISTTGGNPDLGRGRRNSLSLNARILPFDDPTLTLNLGYRRRVATGGVTGFPELTPTIEALFPERITRDADGRLIAIDTRAINLVRESDAELTSGVALRLPGPRRAAPGARSPRLPANPLRLSATLTHRLRLESRLLTREGTPPIDRLGAEGGQSRHFLSLQFNAGKRGIVGNLGGNWSSASRVAGPSGQDFRVRPPATFNLSLFVEPHHLIAATRRPTWTNHLKLSLDIQNLTAAYRRVTFDDGRVPMGFSRDEIDPLGRTARLTLRKRF